MKRTIALWLVGLFSVLLFVACGGTDSAVEVDSADTDVVVADATDAPEPTDEPTEAPVADSAEEEVAEAEEEVEAADAGEVPNFSGPYIQPEDLTLVGNTGNIQFLNAYTDW